MQGYMTMLQPCLGAPVPTTHLRCQQQCGVGRRNSAGLQQCHSPTHRVAMKHSSHSRWAGYNPVAPRCSSSRVRRSARLTPQALSHLHVPIHTPPPAATPGPNIRAMAAQGCMFALKTVHSRGKRFAAVEAVSPRPHPAASSHMDHPSLAKCQLGRVQVLRVLVHSLIVGSPTLPKKLKGGPLPAQIASGIPHRKVQVLSISVVLDG
ncbi:hypothetical protein NDU88_001769 [Pleurodeles waltl]|uniref:Uncharacterized protein n=1 Tax=Pleurodeles waltl TaxID=8319 RepID=A0AAV7WNG4_PLEWA|nr:hypothetical protein NDU88_001769 [Pleurodeles waltl]